MNFIICFDEQEYNVILAPRICYAVRKYSEVLVKILDTYLRNSIEDIVLLRQYLIYDLKAIVNTLYN
jgi:hypothetical protein